MRAPKLKSFWLALLGAFACGCSAEPAPAPRSPLTLQVKTNALITKDLDEAWVTIKQDGAEVYHWELKLDPLLGADTLPVEVELIPGTAKAPYIEFLVEARRNGEAVSQWRRGLLLPSDPGTLLDTQLQNERDARALAEGPVPQATTAEAESYDAPVEPARARLDIEIDGLCLDPPVTCPDTQTCIRGRCVDSEVKFDELPLLRESEVIPPQGVAAPCLDVEECFADAKELVPLAEPCTFVTPSGGGELSLAAQLKDSRVGYCDSGACLLPLQHGQYEDWTESDGVITLEPELCELGLVGHVLATHGCDITPSTSFCSTHFPTSGEGGAGGAEGGAPPDAGGEGGTGGDDSPSGPVVLASGRSAPWTIAVNAKGIFWLEPTQVMRVALDGGTPSELATGDFVAEPSSLTLSDSTLYYTNSAAGGTSGTVMAVPLEGGADPTPFAPAQGGQPWGVMASAGFVYWTTLDAPSILRALERPGSTADAFHNALESPRIYECVADSENLYWGDAMGTIFKQGLSASESTWLRDPMQGATDAVVRLAVASGSVFWTTGTPSLPTSPTPGASVLYKVPIAGGDVAELASGDSVTAAVAADETGVYYCDGALKRLPHDGGSAQVIAEGQRAAAIALDESYVYWTDATAGTVMRAPK